MRNKIEALPDAVLNEYATRFIFGECWHDFAGPGWRASFDKVMCSRCEKYNASVLPNMNYCSSWGAAIKLVEKLKDLIIEGGEKGIEYPLNYGAFAIHVKNCCLLGKDYANPQKLYHEEFFLLYLIKPRQIVEATLLAVDYEKQI